MAKNLYRFAYPCPVRPPADPKLHQMRDGAAFMEISMPLIASGFKYRSVICNYPYREGNGDIILGREAFRFIEPGDCLVQVNRPPLHDHLTRNRKKILRSRSHLEDTIFTGMGAWFEFVCREQLRLAPALLGQLAPDIPGRWHFRQTHDARIARIGSRDPGKKDRRIKPTDYCSLGCFFHLPTLPGYGCRLIVSFGMGGFETLVWNRIVRARFAHWLERPGFVLATMDLHRVPMRPLHLAFAEEVPVHVLIDVPINSVDPTGP